MPHQHGTPMSMARFAFPAGLARRTRTDVARLASRLIRNADFARQEEDGTIVVVFAGSGLHQAHIVTRAHRERNAPHRARPTLEDGPLRPMVTLAALKATDTPSSLLARVSETTTVAAE